jgi:hypothetical protein
VCINSYIVAKNDMKSWATSHLELIASTSVSVLIVPDAKVCGRKEVDGDTFIHLSIWEGERWCQYNLLCGLGKMWWDLQDMLPEALMKKWLPNQIWHPPNPPLHTYAPTLYSTYYVRCPGAGSLVTYLQFTWPAGVALRDFLQVSTRF